MRSSMLALALVACLWPTEDAHAQEWVYERGVRTAQTGLVFGAAGPPAAVVGAVAGFAGAWSGNGTLAVGGLVLGVGGAAATIAGPPMLAHGVRRARLALEEVGPPVSRVAENLTIALALGSAGCFVLSSVWFEASEVLALAGTGAYVGSLVSGGVQIGVVRDAYRDLPWNRAPDEQTVSVTVAPMVSGHTRGMAIVGRF